MAKIWNFNSFGGCIPTFLPHKREIWHGGADLWSALPCQKAYFWTTEWKQYRHGCAGLPVII